MMPHFQANTPAGFPPRTKRMPTAMDHNRFGSTPGNHWDTKQQCQMLLKDDEAYPDEKSDGKGITI